MRWSLRFIVPPVLEGLYHQPSFARLLPATPIEVLVRRVGFAVALAVGLIVAPLAAEAQPAEKSARIGYLAFDLRGGDPDIRASFLQGLRDLGYTEGRNVEIEYREVALLGKPDAVPDRAEKDRLEAAKATARALGIQLQIVEARGPQEFDRSTPEA
jgi:hypothetical protein